jgi:hypothetical protein
MRAISLYFYFQARRPGAIMCKQAVLKGWGRIAFISVAIILMDIIHRPVFA